MALLGAALGALAAGSDAALVGATSGGADAIGGSDTLADGCAVAQPMKASDAMTTTAANLRWTDPPMRPASPLVRPLG